MKLNLALVLVGTASSFHSTAHAMVINDPSFQSVAVEGAGDAGGFFNLTNLSTPPDKCWKDTESYKPTTVETCKRLLDKIKTFADYNVKQRFEEKKYPKRPVKPPFLFSVKDCSCEMEISAGGSDIADNFSFRDVRDKITEIVEDCQPPRGSGLGGWDYVGPKNIWFIIVRGITPRAELSAFEEVYPGVSYEEDSIIYPLGVRAPPEVTTFRDRRA